MAVNVVGAAMTHKKTEDDWDHALNLMRYADPNFPKFHKGIDAQLYQKLMYSYNDLPDHNLKCCFLYCAAFPKDEEINAERLVEIWIAEGLLTGKETTYLMDVGHDYLDLLANRWLIQYVVPGEYVEVDDKYEYVKTIKIHDVLRDMALHIGESEEHWLFATDQHLTNFPGEKEISNCNRISLGHNDIQELTVLECPNLVSLLLPFNRTLRHVPQPFLSSVISLRVLDLSWTRIAGLPESVGELRLLEFLDLSHCEELIELPESIGNLSALQFFNLNGCYKLKGLPSTIRGLKASQFG